jgi:hypothetical protein
LARESFETCSFKAHQVADLLRMIPGVRRVVAAVIVAEIGVDM